MKIRHLLLTLLLVSSAAAYAQDGGIRGKVVSRNDRAALGNVKVVVEPAGIVVTTDAEGRFRIANLPKGDYELRFDTPDYENLDIAVRVDKIEKDLRSVVMSPDVQDGIDDSVFAEFDSEVATDAQSLPSSLSASKDVFNNIASYLSLIHI